MSLRLVKALTTKGRREIALQKCVSLVSPHLRWTKLVLQFRFGDIGASQVADAPQYVLAHIGALTHMDNPLLGFDAAVARLTQQGDSPRGPQGLFPQERLTRAEALKGMTLDAAYAAFAEDVLGLLARGKRADFVVPGRDIMREDAGTPQDILQEKVAATVVHGRLVYGGI